MNPDSRRLAKQFVYGFFFCLFWAAIIWGGYKLFWGAPASCFDNKQNQNETGVDCGGTCLDCAIRTLRPIELTGQKIFSLNGQTALLEFKNPNPLYGAINLTYNIEIKNMAGTAIESITGETFIYPGEVKYIIKELPITEPGISFAVTFRDPTWKSAAEFSSPKMTFRGVTSKLENSGSIFISGVLQNNETLLFPRVIINTLFFDGNYNVIGVSKTEILDVTAFEERYFQIEHPQLPNLDLAKTRIFFEAKRP